jgi:hypothetical protein
LTKSSNMSMDGYNYVGLKKIEGSATFHCECPCN